MWPAWLPRETRSSRRRGPAVPARIRLAGLPVAVGAGARPGGAVRIEAHHGHLPVVEVVAGVPAQEAQRAAVPDLVGSEHGAVGVGVVEPVGDVEAAARPPALGEHRGPVARIGPVSVEVAVVRGLRARPPPAAPVVHRELPLARLVDQARRERADSLGVARPIHAREGAVAILTPPLTAQTILWARKPPKERPSARGTSATRPPKPSDASSTSPIHSTLAWPRSDPMRPTVGRAGARVYAECD